MNSAIFKGYDSIFAKRLRSLIDEKGTTIQAVAENISDMSGTKITRQAVSQYADGTTMPNAERVYYIAQYFGVSADYLLGLSDVQSTDTTVKGVCDFTGLSENTVNRLKFLNMYSFEENFNRFLNDFVSSYNFECIIYEIANYYNISKQLKEIVNNQLLGDSSEEKFNNLNDKRDLSLFKASKEIISIIEEISKDFEITSKEKQSYYNKVNSRNEL